VKENRSQARAYGLYFPAILLLIILVFLVALFYMKRITNGLQQTMADQEKLLLDKMEKETGLLSCALKTTQELFQNGTAELRLKLTEKTGSLETRFNDVQQVISLMEGSIHKSNQNLEDGINIVRNMIQSKMKEIDLRIAGLEQKKEG